MGELKYVPVFGESLAQELAKEGYIIDRYGENKKKQGQRIYYFRYCPGIYQDMNEISRRAKVTDKATVAVYSLGLARKLMNMGFIISHTNKNLNNPKLKVYFFKNAEGLEDEIRNYREAVKANEKRQSV